MTTLTIRPATATDLPALSRLEPPGSGVAAAHLATQEQGRGTFLVAFRRADPLGSCVLTSTDFPELRFLHVTPAARGAGVGTALIHAAEALAREAGAPKVLLDVDVGNTRARALYERLGYRATGRKRRVTYDYVDPEGLTRTDTSDLMGMELVLGGQG